jgi:hypothetical protein
MTEQEWLNCTHPDLMLRFLYGLEASRRKLRLFGYSCFPAIRDLWRDKRVTEAVEIAERYADGLVSHGEKEKVRYWASSFSQEDDCSDPGIVASAVAALNHNAETASWSLAEAEACVAAGWYKDDWQAARGSEKFLTMCDPAGVIARDAVRSVQCDRLHCIFGNPFRPLSVNPPWLTLAVVELAQAIYNDRAFDRMPSLADALEEASCTDADLLGHCRGAGPHVQGFWVVDSLMGKE